MTYKIQVAGLERELPLCPLNEETMIAAPSLPLVKRETLGAARA